MGSINEHFCLLLRRANFEEIDWLRDILDGQPDLSGKVDTDIWEAFQQRIQESYHDSSGESKDLLGEIAGLAGIELDDSEEEDSEDEEVDQIED